MLSRNAFLVDLVDTEEGRVLKLDSIENGNTWKGYDMLIFNTWHWWLHKGSKQPYVKRKPHKTQLFALQYAIIYTLRDKNYYYNIELSLTKLVIADMLLTLHPSSNLPPRSLDWFKVNYSLHK